MRLRRGQISLGVCLLAVVLTGTTAADEIVWQTDVAEAWGEAVEERRPLLVFVTSDHCKFCTKMKTSTYGDERIVDQVSEGFVPLAVDSSVEEKFARDLKVAAYPTTLVIAPDKTIVDRIKGHVTPAELRKRLAEAEQRVASLERRETTSRRIPTKIR